VDVKDIVPPLILNILLLSTVQEELYLFNRVPDTKFIVPLFITVDA
jgi:hypothetical protein